MERVLFKLPMSCGEINRKVAAWKELFSGEPRILLDGDLYTDTNEIAFLRENTVRRIGRQYMDVCADGELCKVNPQRLTHRCKGYVILEKDR